MKHLLLFLALTILLCACEKERDRDGPRDWYTQLSVVKRRTFYDWDKITQVHSDTVHFGIGVEFLYKGESRAMYGLIDGELEISRSKFYTDREIIVDNDTIPKSSNLLFDTRLAPYLSFYKEGDAEYNFPQYLVALNNRSRFLNGDYTFYFEGITTEKPYPFTDSCIVRIQ